jgi:hypothetical protein
MIKKLAIVRRQLSLWNESFLKNQDEKQRIGENKIHKQIEEEKEDLIDFKSNKGPDVKRRKLEER